MAGFDLNNFHFRMISLSERWLVLMLNITLTLQLAEEKTVVRLQWSRQWNEATLLQSLATNTSEISFGLLELLLEHG